MANPFEQMAARMDAATIRCMGAPVTINGIDYVAIESHFVPEMGPVTGDGISLVVFSENYHPRRNDALIWKGTATKLRAASFLTVSHKSGLNRRLSCPLLTGLSRQLQTSTASVKRRSPCFSSGC
jgi:hypothetical protein